MKYPAILITTIFLSILLISFSQKEHVPTAKQDSNGKEYKIQKTDAEWQAELSPEEYRVLINKGTERAFTGKYDKFYKDGSYNCAACGHQLFSSESKFNSGTGWPSFYEPAADECIWEITDESYGMIRVEAVCGNCGGHLGHVFDDGPEPTGLRYCINSVSLDFVKQNRSTEKENTGEQK